MKVSRGVGLWSVALALLVGVSGAGCGRATVGVVERGEGRGTFEFVRPPAPPKAGEIKVAESESLVKDEWVAPRAVGKLVEPVYPGGALAAGEGPVVMAMRLVVDTEGKVREVAQSVREWSTPTPWAAEIRTAIEVAVAQWRFRPAEVRHFTTVTNANGTYRSLVSSEKTEWALHVTFTFKVEGGGGGK